MSKLIDSIIEKASKLGKTIVLAEGEEPRTIEAAQKISKKGVAKLIMLGDVNKIKEIAPDFSFDGIEVIDYRNYDIEDFAQTLYELRKAKGMTIEQAREQMQKDALSFGAMLVRKGMADGMVAGAINSTGNVLRAGLTIVKTAPGVKTVSSCFMMCFDHTLYTEREFVVFGDCAVNINPTAEQLADIAASSAQTAKALVGLKEPRVAMLSFSTKGSGKHESVDVVVEATKIVKEKHPELEVDGELQADAALVQEVADLKAPNSKVAGKANILIFPNLAAGNIGYKLVQRFAKAEAVGPVCQGFAKPINDLSRGCNSEDIVGVVAMTCLQAETI